jgi:hypothetical protein
VAGEELDRATEERDRGGRCLVGQDFGVGEAGGDVDVVPADRFALADVRVGAVEAGVAAELGWAASLQTNVRIRAPDARCLTFADRDAQNERETLGSCISFSRSL